MFVVRARRETLVRIRKAQDEELMVCDGGRGEERAKKNRWTRNTSKRSPNRQWMAARGLTRGNIILGIYLGTRTHKVNNIIYILYIYGRVIYTRTMM